MIDVLPMFLFLPVLLQGRLVRGACVVLFGRCGRVDKLLVRGGELGRLLLGLTVYISLYNIDGYSETWIVLIRVLLIVVYSVCSVFDMVTCSTVSFE